MDRKQVAVLALMLVVAVAAGVLVASFAPPVSTASAEELKLAPAPPAAQAVQVPSFADLADRALPSVVNIISTRYVTARDPHEDLFDNPFFRRFFREPFGQQDEDQEGEGDSRRGGGEERRAPQNWGGSGFFITADGYILTNKHVVDKAEDVEVRTSDEHEYKGRIVGVDPYLDLAVIKVDGDRPFQPLPLGDSDLLRVGEWVVAIGNPLAFRNTVTVGVVSGKGRRLEQATFSLGDYIQTDAAINFGNSGGPLLNARGEVVGINTAIIRNGGGDIFGGSSSLIEGIGFALPITTARRGLDQLVRTGTVRRGYLGVGVRSLDPTSAAYYGLKEPTGALVSNVEEKTPAGRAGLQSEDIITAVDGKKVHDSAELVNEIAARSPGDKVRLTVWRYNTSTGKGREFDTTVTLEERRVGQDEEQGAGEPEEQTEETALGFTVGPISSSVRENLERRGEPVEGVIVTDVDPTSAAYREGLRENDILTNISGTAISSVEDYRKATKEIKPGQIVRLRVRTARAGDLLLFFRAPGNEKK